LVDSWFVIKEGTRSRRGHVVW